MILSKTVRRFFQSVHSVTILPVLSISVHDGRLSYQLVVIIPVVFNMLIYILNKSPKMQYKSANILNFQIDP